MIILRFYRDSTVIHDPMPWIIPVFSHFAIFCLNHQVDLKTCTVRNISGKWNRELRVINWIHCQPFYENRKNQTFALFTPLLHSIIHGNVTLPAGVSFRYGFSIHEVLFVGSIHVVGLFTSFMLIKSCRNRQTSTSRVGNVAGSRRFDKEEVGKRGSSRVVQLFSSIESV